MKIDLLRLKELENVDLHTHMCALVCGLDKEMSQTRVNFLQLDLHLILESTKKVST